MNKQSLVQSLRNIICSIDYNDKKLFVETVVSTHDKGPQKILDIIQALVRHIDSTYMLKSPDDSFNPLSVIATACPENVRCDLERDDGNFDLLNSLVEAFNCKLKAKTTTVVNIENNTITPRTFQCKKGTCHLTMVVNKINGKYHPFNNKTYFPRFTLDNDATYPQIHSLCFFVVKDKIKNEWEVLTLKYPNSEMFANNITDKNAYALVYIGQDVTDNLFNFSEFSKAINHGRNGSIIHVTIERGKDSVIDYDTFKKLIHPQLFMNFYHTDHMSTLEMVYNSVKGALASN